MYLHLNSTNRPMLFEKFSDIMNSKPEKLSNNYVLALLNPNCRSKYDLVVSFLTEKVSKKKYAQARFVQNPTGKLHWDDSFIELQTFDAMSVFPPEYLLNGYLQLDGKIPPSVLDDYTALTKLLDSFFDKMLKEKLKVLESDILKHIQLCRDIEDSVEKDIIVRRLTDFKNEWNSLTGIVWTPSKE